MYFSSIYICGNGGPERLSTLLTVTQWEKKKKKRRSHSEYRNWELNQADLTRGSMNISQTPATLFDSWRGWGRPRFNVPIPFLPTWENCLIPLTFASHCCPSPGSFTHSKNNGENPMRFHTLCLLLRSPRTEGVVKCQRECKDETPGGQGSVMPWWWNWK